jgi:hypothetical protein
MEHMIAMFFYVKDITSFYTPEVLRNVFVNMTV